MTALPTIVLDHFSFGVPELGACIDYLEGELGGEPCEIGPAGPFTWAQWRFAHEARLELIEPRGEAGFLHRFLAARGPGLHHITFKVPSLPEAAARASALGYDVVGYDDSQPSWKELFLHPKQALGVVIQLAESHPELWLPTAPALAFPRRIERRPEPAAVQCLVMRAPDAEAALRPFQSLLGGTLEPAPRSSPQSLCFHWPGSPHRIVVELSAAPAGAKELRVSSARALAPCPQQRFGTPIVQVPAPAGA